MKTTDPKFPIFSRLTKFQQCIFKKIYGILTSPDSPTKIPYNRCLYVEVHCALVEYEKGKAQSAHYLIQIIDFDDPYDQRQEWFSERRELFTDPALARAIDFYNIYHQRWALIEWGKTLMHCQNTIFADDIEFNECMTVEGVVSVDILDYLFDVGTEKYLSEKKEISSWII